MVSQIETTTFTKTPSTAQKRELRNTYCYPLSVNLPKVEEMREGQRSQGNKCLMTTELKMVPHYISPFEETQVCIILASNQFVLHTLLALLETFMKQFSSKDTRNVIVLTQTEPQTPFSAN